MVTAGARHTNSMATGGAKQDNSHSPPALTVVGAPQAETLPANITTTAANHPLTTCTHEIECGIIRVLFREFPAGAPLRGSSVSNAGEVEPWKTLPAMIRLSGRRRVFRIEQRLIAQYDGEQCAVHLESIA
jgi:hypothetical protein